MSAPRPGPARKPKAAAPAADAAPARSREAIVFSRPLAIPEGFEDRSMHIFALPAPGGGEASSAASLDFDPNVVITRRKTGAPLEAVAAEAVASLREPPPAGRRIVREGDREVAGLPAREIELRVDAEGPPPLLLAQWLVLVCREGYAYSFVCTTPEARSAVDRPRFEKLIAGWR